MSRKGFEVTGVGYIEENYEGWKCFTSYKHGRAYLCYEPTPSGLLWKLRGRLAIRHLRCKRPYRNTSYGLQALMIGRKLGLF